MALPSRTKMEEKVTANKVALDKKKNNKIKLRSRNVLLSAAALDCAVVDGAERITAVTVHIHGAEWSSVLILLLLVAAKCIT